MYSRSRRIVELVTERIESVIFEADDESSDDIIDSVSENRDAKFQPEQVTSSSEDSEVDPSATNNNIIVNSLRGRGVSRRFISGGRTTRGGGSARTSSVPEDGMLQVASDGTEWTFISPDTSVVECRS
ncbi:unnamed protein product [Danaus chrysippus]|uniref:(African queen) hypothetical protein n=1 Tax=Danaus chrysippus TaxID=151541 RepID=A0A8J2QXH8_9NEOP|nr:unnamed protein product [Danaus chrysippus]